MWAEIRGYFLSRYLNILLLFVPGLLVLEYLHVGAVWLFAASALAIVPLAGVLGDATEEIAARGEETLEKVRKKRWSDILPSKS